jgi:hypothetical protein
MGKSQVKAKKIIFFDIRGVIVIEWVAEGQTVSQEYYLEVLTKTQERARKKMPESCKKKSWILHQDNVPAYNTLIMKELSANQCITVLEQPSLSLPCYFFLFPKVKRVLKRTLFSLLMR